MNWYCQAWTWDTFAWVSLKSVYILTAMSNIVDFRTTWISPCQSAIRLQKQSNIIASDQSALAQSISNFSALALLGKFGLHPNILPRAEIILHISDVSWNESPKGNATGNLRAEVLNLWIIARALRRRWPGTPQLKNLSKKEVKRKHITRKHMLIDDQGQRQRCANCRKNRISEAILSKTGGGS